MKKFLYSLILILLCCTFVLTACGAKGLADNPSTNAPVSGNGGFAVVKGDYLYYTNGYLENYTSVYNTAGSNDLGKTSFGAIYRTKLVNGNVRYNEDGTLVKTELVVSKLVGYEYGGFYIFGDYIYYATPHMEKEKGGTLRNDLIDFNRIKIDGTDNKEKLYVTSTSVTRKDWRMYSVDGNVYIVLAEVENGNTSLKSVAINAKAKVTVKTLASNVKTYALYDGAVDSATTRFVYFTKDKDSGTGNNFSKVNFVSGQVVSLIDATNSTTTFEVLAYTDHKIYYSAETPIGSASETKLQYISIDATFSMNQATTFAHNKYDEYCVASYNSNIIAMRNGTSSVVISAYGTVNLAHTIEATSGENSLLGFYGDELFYVNSSGTLRKAQVTTDVTQEYVSLNVFENDKTVLTDAVDLNGNSVYMFASYTSGADSNSHYYLNKLNGTDIRFVGQFVSNHAPAKPTDEEEIWIY